MTRKYNFTRLKTYIKETQQDFKNISWTPAVIFNTIYHSISNIFIFCIILSVLFLSLLAGFGAGYFAALVKDEPIKNNAAIKKSLYQMTESSTVYFGTGQSLGSLNADLQREVIDYKKISPHIVDALIATEDENFYHHNGIVPKAFIRATAQEFLNSNVSSGGSTITQQLIKNQLLTNETSFERKAKEMLLSFRVEKTMSKKEILEAYLNVVSFGRNTNGQNVAGVDAAARGIFGKHADELNIAESAYIAGMPQNPYTYTPFLSNGKLKKSADLQYGFERQQYVLERMLKEKKITSKQYKQAKQFNLKKAFKKHVAVPSDKYPYLTEEIERRATDLLKYHFAAEDNISRSELDDTPVLSDKYSAIAAKALRNKGYVIDTTINKKMMDTMDQIKNNPNYYSYDRPVTGQKMQQQEVGVLLKDNDSGKILAFVGGRDHKTSQNNHATQTKRSPGSTMKPLLTYAPAVEYGVIAPETMLLDRRFDYNGYSPQNYAKIEYGQVTARVALENSFNLSTLRLYSSIQQREPWKFLSRMNIDIPATQQQNLSLPLGATDITLEDDVDGFSTLANGGKYQESYMIQSIRTRDGKVVYEHQARPKRVFSDATAYIMTDMLRGVLDTGSAYQLKGTFQYNQDWAGKTGTAQDATDSLFVAYNPKVTMGVWMGYDKPTTFDEENHYQLKLWRDIANAVTAVDQKAMGVGERFQQPASVSTAQLCQITNSLSGSCSSGEPVKASLVSKKTDLSQKTLDSQAVLARLGIMLDADTAKKLSVKKDIATKTDQLAQPKTKKKTR